MFLKENSRKSCFPEGKNFFLAQSKAKLYDFLGGVFLRWENCYALLAVAAECMGGRELATLIQALKESFSLSQDINIYSRFCVIWDSISLLNQDNCSTTVQSQLKLFSQVTFSPNCKILTRVSISFSCFWGYFLFWGYHFVRVPHHLPPPRWCVSSANTIWVVSYRQNHKQKIELLWIWLKKKKKRVCACV